MYDPTANPLRLQAPTRWLRPFVPVIEHALGLAPLAELYGRRPGCLDADAFLAWLLNELGVRVRIDNEDLDRIPDSGPAVVLANHPLGGLEGLALARMLRSRRSDVKVMANYMLRRIPELRELFLFVDPFDGPDAARRNLASLREALRWVAGGGMLAVFPAGEVAQFRPRRGRIEDPPWSPTIAGLIRRAKCPAVPVWFGGSNGWLFHALGLLHPRLRTALLAREMSRHRDTALEARVGNPVAFRALEQLRDDAAVTAYLRSRTEVLGERAPALETRHPPVQPRATPRHATSVAAATPAAQLEREVESLPAAQRLVEADGQAVYVADARQIPGLLREIGRLREISFRHVGEGTGRELDLDRFDAHYKHLFIWSEAGREVVGAYRLGLTDEIIRAHGREGLYTSTLFAFNRQLFDAMGPALELGRSFIRPEHQKSFAGLLLLWKGIGRFVLDNPNYATLFGPVSISAEYRSASQRLITAFLQQNRFAHDWSRWVRPREPRRADPRRSFRLAPDQLENLEQVSTFISEIESDRKGVPILLKQYLKLGGRLLGFNVDPAFSNVLDVLILVDLRRTEQKILTRYMGREGAARFRAVTDARGREVG